MFILQLSQAAPWHYYATCRLRTRTLNSSTPTRFADVSINLFFFHLWCATYELEGVYETFLSLFYTPWDSYKKWYIKWWVHKSLLEWGFRRNLVCFSQSQRCTDYNDFFHCSIRARVSYCLLWTAICLIKKKTWIKLILFLLRNKIVFTSHWNTGNLSIVT